jgi:hypothetical protein
VFFLYIWFTTPLPPFSLHGVGSVTPGHVGDFWECSPPWALSSAKRPRLLKVRVTLRLMVAQSVSLGVEPHEIFITIWQLHSCFCGAPFWWEDGSVFCICCCPSPAQSFSGQSPLGLAAIFYCLSFETSLSIVSYGSQGHGICIPPCPHTGMQWERYKISNEESTLVTQPKT